MIDTHNRMWFAVLILAACVFSASVTVIFMAESENSRCFQTIGQVFGKMTQEEPQIETRLMSLVKEYLEQPEDSRKENLLETYGYTEEALHSPMKPALFRFAVAAVMMTMALVAAVLYFGYRAWDKKIKSLTCYLEGVNANRPGMLAEGSTGAFGHLQDELYKTVTALTKTREEAVRAKENFAENLSNIAHQLKTPITALSLQTQMLKAECNEDPKKKMEQQLKRLQYLEEALLLMARIDAGTLSFEEMEVDVFTVLTLAADNLQELSKELNLNIQIQEKEETSFVGDLEWTMEAVMNLMKNCMEHAKAGSSIYCEYEKNSLYLELRIYDEGEGVAKEDLPYLFDRFYRGKGEKGNGIGIGLPLAKAIIERQNGVITARNLQGKGACFEIRIYSQK